MVLIEWVPSMQNRPFEDEEKVVFSFLMFNGGQVEWTNGESLVLEF